LSDNELMYQVMPSLCPFNMPRKAATKCVTEAKDAAGFSMYWGFFVVRVKRTMFQSCLVVFR